MKINGATSTANTVGRRELVLAALDEFERPLTRYAQRMFGTSAVDSLESARDAVQHTFLKLCQQSPEEIAPKLGPWLYRVCRNRVIDQLRSKGNYCETWPPAVDILDLAAGPSELAERDEISQRLGHLISQLSGMEREVIELWSQGLSHQEIAKVLEKKPGAVRVGLHRAMKKLKNHPEVRSWLDRATSQPLGASKGVKSSAPSALNSSKCTQGERS